MIVSMVLLPMTLLQSQHLGLGRGRSIGSPSASNAQFGTRGARWVGMVTSSWRIVKYSQSPRITDQEIDGMRSMEDGFEKEGLRVRALL